MRKNNELQNVVFETLNWLAASIKEMDMMLMYARDEKIVDNVDDMTEEEAGECWIDEEDLERALEILRKAALDKMVAEQAQEMSDEYIGLTPGTDREQLLNQVIDVQEKMAVQMLEINREAEFKDVLYSTYAPKRDRFTNAKACLEDWKCKHGTTRTFPWWKQWKEAKYDRDLAWQYFNEQRDAVSKLWSHWWTLKNACDVLTTNDRGVWKDYFDLVNNPLDARNVYGDTEEFDDQHHLVVDMHVAPREVGSSLVLLNEMVSVTPQRRLDGEIEAHLAEMAQYDRPYTAWERNCKPYPRYMSGRCVDVTKKRIEMEKRFMDQSWRAKQILAVMKADAVRYKKDKKPSLFNTVLDDAWNHTTTSSEPTPKVTVHTEDNTLRRHVDNCLQS